ncbi:CD8a molecule L homeolog precursor [Xenopus laevis]|uniref:T-cell surface glycoprotein CD8 alpha chain n=1 Tax=Xenopus laevis TaxID=8355 RepID=E9LP48_XENLA|nr:CD8 subunit alpha L homeolog precursor [Xenopus laevis]ADV71260.1 CD8alpha receptor [Xenopus laevis]
MELFLMALFLCNWITGTQQLGLTQTSGSLTKEKSETVKLECKPGPKESMDNAVFWFRQRKDTKTPESILYLSSVSKQKLSDDNVFKHFTANKGAFTFTLNIFPFQEKDEGTYYCMININSVLSISPGLQLFYPAVTTPAPTTTKPPTTTTKMADPDKKDPCGCNGSKSDPVTNDWGIQCEMYILASLGGLCSLLLLALLTTSILLCKRGRPRRCRCKHVPETEKNGKPKPAPRYV